MPSDPITPWNDRRHRSWRGHSRWFVPLALSAAIYLGALAAVTALTPDGDEEVGALHALGVLALFGLAFVGPAVCLVLAAVGAHGIWRSWRRSRGRFTKGDQRWIARRRAAEAEQDADRRALRGALALREELLAGASPAALPVHDVLPARGETFHLRGDARYQRYYGQDVSYSTSSTMAFGRPTFVAAALVASAASNASARSRAHAMARAQWREDQMLEIVVSNQRIRCRTAAHGWLNFDFEGISAIYPDLAQRTVILEFEQGAPLLLTSRLVPAACVLAIHARLGAEGLRNHPTVGQLVQSARS